MNREGYVFVIANTCVVADKYVTAPIHYNLRVVETRLAAAVLAKLIGVNVEGCVTLRGVFDLYWIQHGTECMDIMDKFDKMLLLLEKKLHEIHYTFDEIAGILQLSVKTQIINILLI